MGRLSETNEAIMLDQYIEALLDNPEILPPANLDPELAQLARSILLSLNQNVEYPVLLDIWQDSLMQVQYLATKGVAHSSSNHQSKVKAEPTLTTYHVPIRPQNWNASLLISSAAIFLMVMLFGTYQFMHNDDEPTAIESAHEQATGIPTSFITTTPFPTTEEILITVILPDELTCSVGETVNFELANVGQAVSVVSSDIFKASVNAIETVEENRVAVEVDCLDVGNIELAVTIVQDLESFAETIDLHITEADQPNAIIVTPANTQSAPSAIPLPTATTAFIPSATPSGDAYPAPVITSSLHTALTCAAGNGIVLEYDYTYAVGVFTAARMFSSNNNVRDRIVTVDNGSGVLGIDCVKVGTATVTLYVFYPEFGIPPEPSIATTHTINITITQETAMPPTPDPNYPVPIYEDVPTSLTCAEGDSQRVDIEFSANSEANPGQLWFSVFSDNAQMVIAHSTSANHIDSGFFWFDCGQVGSTTITLQLYRLADSGDPNKAAYHDIAITVNSATTPTPTPTTNPNYPIPSFVNPPSATNCAPSTTIQIPFAYAANPTVGGPITAFASADSANQNILIQQLVYDANTSTLHLNCNTLGTGTVTLYTYKVGDISSADMQAGNWSKAAQHQFNVNVILLTPTPDVSPTPTPSATFTPTPTSTPTATQ